MDNITLAALVYWLLRLRPKADAPQEIWYFDEVSSSARWALKVLAVLGYGKIKVVQVDYRWGQLRSDDGNPVWHEVANRDLTLICDRVRELEGCGFLHKLGAGQGA